jgi:hypothetical protein
MQTAGWGGAKSGSNLATENGGTDTIPFRRQINSADLSKSPPGRVYETQPIAFTTACRAEP